MGPIEENLSQVVSQQLAQGGVQAAHVTVLSAEAEDWRYRIEAAGRMFEFGFNHREQLWARETTPGAQRHLVSNDAPRIHVSEQARITGVELILCAILFPAAMRRDPPVI